MPAEKRYPHRVNLDGSWDTRAGSHLTTQSASPSLVALKQHA